MKIALDSNCLTYLINACESKLGIDPSIAEEGIALIRIWFYLDERYFISKQVLDECGPIGDNALRDMHLAFANRTYFGLETKAPATVEAHVNQYLSIHPRKKDCRVLAEAEDMGVDILLSYDNDFISHLGRYSDSVRIMRPSDYWKLVQMPRGTAPKVRPHVSNPLANKTFWLW